MKNGCISVDSLQSRESDFSHIRANSPAARQKTPNTVQSQLDPQSHNSFSKCMTCCPPYARGGTICLQAAFHAVNIFTLIPREETSILQVCARQMSRREVCSYFRPCWIYAIGLTTTPRCRAFSLIADTKLQALINILTSLTCRDSVLKLSSNFSLSVKVFQKYIHSRSNVPKLVCLLIT